MDHWNDHRQAEEKKDVNIVRDLMKKADAKKNKGAKLARKDSEKVEF